MTTLDLFVLEDRRPRHFLHNRARGLAQCLCKEKTTPPEKPSKESSGEAIFFAGPALAPGEMRRTVGGIQPSPVIVHLHYTGAAGRGRGNPWKKTKYLRRFPADLA